MKFGIRPSGDLRKEATGTFIDWKIDSEEASPAYFRREFSIYKKLERFSTLYEDPEARISFQAEPYFLLPLFMNLFQVYSKKERTFEFIPSPDSPFWGHDNWGTVINGIGTAKSLYCLDLGKETEGESFFFKKSLIRSLRISQREGEEVLGEVSFHFKKLEKGTGFESSRKKLDNLREGSYEGLKEEISSLGFSWSANSFWERILGNAPLFYFIPPTLRLEISFFPDSSTFFPHFEGSFHWLSRENFELHIFGSFSILSYQPFLTPSDFTFTSEYFSTNYLVRIIFPPEETSSFWLL